MSLPSCDTCRHYVTNPKGLHPLCSNEKTEFLNPIYDRQSGGVCGPDGKLHEQREEVTHGNPASSQG